MIDKPKYFPVSFLVFLITAGMIGGLGVGLHYFSTTMSVCQFTEENFKPTENYKTPEEESKACLDAFKQTQLNILIGFPLMGVVLGIFRSILDYKSAVNAWNWAKQQNWRCKYCSSTLTEDNLCSYGKEKIVFCEPCGKKQYGDMLK